MNTAIWIKRIKCLVIVSLITSIGNLISTTKAGNPVSPLDAIPGLFFLLVCTVLGCIVYELINKVSPKNLPAIAYISLVTILLTIPGFSPIAEWAIAATNKVGLLPLCTPILAYAGISIGKDLDTFKKQGVSIVIIALFTFVGTYVGSAIIAEIILRSTGVI